MRFEKKRSSKLIKRYNLAKVIHQMDGKNNLVKKHVYRIREQVPSSNKSKDELKTREALVHVDYSESYNNIQ